MHQARYYTQVSQGHPEGVGARKLHEKTYSDIDEHCIVCGCVGSPPHGCGA